MRARADVTRAAGARRAPRAALAGVALAVAVGGVGQDYRGLGLLALSELAVTSGLRRSGWLAHRPLPRAAMRLAVAAMAVNVVGASMPPARLVASLFLLEGVIRLGVVALFWRAGAEWAQLRPQAKLAWLESIVGLWFVSVPLPPSGWSPVVGVLLAGAALTSANRPQAASVEEEC